MSVRVAINGFGRIGRLVLRAAVESGRKDLQLVAINNRSDIATTAHLLKYDSIHGRYPGDVKIIGDTLNIDSNSIRVFRESKPDDIRWNEVGVDVVLECTGAFRDKDSNMAHIENGAGRVLISAPGKNCDATIVYGVNQADLKPEHKVVSNASCTTNCLAPIAKVLHEAFGIKRGFMTTVHAYTTDQRILDNSHKDLRRARAAGLSLIPTTTGAARSVGLVIPELEGRLDGASIRVPVPNVSMVDLVFVPDKQASVDDVHRVMRTAAAGPLKGVLEFCDEPLVSADFNHHSASAIYDAQETAVIDGGLIRVAAWYDNEWGFSHRMNDMAALMGPQLGQV